MFPKTKVAFKIFYDGKDYHGLALQENKTTISNTILNTLLSLNLIYSIEECNLEYAGRTDTGVSAVGMVISLFVRINKKMKLDIMLNSRLPHTIRILGYAIVDDNFSARFNCILREYRYYFNKIETKQMKITAEKIKYLKYFKYLCKKSKEKEFRKKDLSFDENYYNREIRYINIIEDENINYLEIGAKSFLHNMVRKIFYLISNPDENILKNLLDHKEVQIGTADAQPLVFYRAKYENEINWIISEKTEEENNKIKNTKILELEKYKFL